jgi:ATP-dependent DNA helicase DinG
VLLVSDFTSLAVVPERTVFMPDPNHHCWGMVDRLPDWVTAFRDHQWQAFLDITAAFNSGADVVLVDAPVGAGKTLIAEMVRRWMQTPTLYVCSGKSLQDQFARDFPYAKVLKGRSNYRTADHPDDPTVSAADCDSSREFLPACSSCPSDGHAAEFDNDNDDDQVPHCSECHPVTACPYRSAKREAVFSALACINTSYFLTEANGPGAFSKRGLVIVDECDLMEKEVMSFYEVSISARRRQQYRIPFPKHKTVTAGTKERLDDEGITYTEWEEWFENTLTLISARRQAMPRKPAERSMRKEATYLDNLIASLKQVKESIANGDWVYTGYDKGDITFKPVTISAFGNEVLWKHGNKWLIMSGTIIDPAEMVESLGLPPEKHWEVVQVPMTFPRENRPIKIIPVAEMSRKNKDEAWPKMAKTIKAIAEKHLDDRILVHSVSYDLTRYLVDFLPPDRVVTYTSAAEREPALQRYLSKPGSILVAPSMDRGVDLPGDACRVQVICKLPFPYLGDKQISTRLYSTKGGQTWYLIQCIRSFVQMTGRGVRNETDFAVTYILDKAFQNNLYKKGRRLLPKYLDEAIDWSGRL